ncbi:DAK2 domain-containing protein [Rothia sp. 32237D007AR]
MRQVPADWWLNWLLRARTQLMEHRSLLNRINVFPVADADTGANMVATLGQAADTAGMADEPTLALAARAALREARGNSGTLLAVWLLGLAQKLGQAGQPGQAGQVGQAHLEGENRQELTPAALAAAWAEGARQASAALSQPAEGTMLTLMQALATCPLPATSDPSPWQTYLTDLLATSEAALRGTAQAAHAQNGWVDSGALGLHLVLVALATELLGAAPPATYRDLLQVETAPLQVRAPHRRSAAGPQVEVMCQIHLTVLEVTKLRSALETVGDSVSIAQVEAGNQALWAIHVHVPHAEDALTLLRAAGEPINVRTSSLTASEDASNDRGDER